MDTTSSIFNRLRCAFLFVGILVAGTTGFAVPQGIAANRVALVIGNSKYENVAKLANPTNDAAAMADILRKGGFDLVEARSDLKTAEFRRSLREFGDKARGADVAVVYFAGHGIEVDGTNYLIPVDAVLERDSDIFDEAFSLDRVLLAIEPARQLRLVILDACRENPFSKTMRRTMGTRSVSRGLARVEPSNPNTLIAYASKAGSTAADGDSSNSPFTAALTRHIATPGLDLRKAFGFVRDDVLKSTGNRQEPFVYGSLGGEDVALVPAKPATAPAAFNPQADIRRDYELALQLGTRSGWQAFLTQFPDGFYANLARGQLDKIATEEARTAATEKARVAREESERLAAEGARADKTAKAVADAKAAEASRLAAEKVNQAQLDKNAVAEKTRIEIEKQGIGKSSASSPSISSQNIAALPSAIPSVPASPATVSVETTRAIQAELQRVGCFEGTISNTWETSARKSLERFNAQAGTRFDVQVASIDALDGVKSKSGRVCPLQCQTGFKAANDRCIKITCAANSVLNNNGECDEKPAAAKQRAARREPSEPRRARPPGRKCFVVGSQSFCE